MEISVDGTPWDKTDRATALFNRTAYYPDSSNNRVVFDSTVLHTGNVITIKNNGYKELPQEHFFLSVVPAVPLQR